MRQSDWRRLAVEVTAGVLVPVGLARIDRSVESLPSLGLLRGPAAFVLVAVAACLALARVVEGRRPGWAAVLARAPAWLLLIAPRRSTPAWGCAMLPGCRSRATSRTTW